MINGVELELGDKGIAVFLDTCLTLGVKPRPSSRFAANAPRPPPGTLQDSPDGLLGRMGYGCKGYTWGPDWPEVARRRIDGAQSFSVTVVNMIYLWHAGWDVGCLWCTYCMLSCGVRLITGFWALAWLMLLPL